MPLRCRSYIKHVARFYPIKIELDGRPYSGEWTIVQGYRVCVRSRGYGTESADIGQSTPQAAAARTLAKIVRDEQKRQADWKVEQARRTRELANLHRPRRTRKPSGQAEA